MSRRRKQSRSGLPIVAHYTVDCEAINRMVGNCDDPLPSNAVDIALTRLATKDDFPAFFGFSGSGNWVSRAEFEKSTATTDNASRRPLMTISEGHTR